MRNLILVLVSFLLVGCQLTNVYSACDGFNYIYISRADTIETQRQVLIHNKVYKELCEVQNAN